MEREEEGYGLDTEAVLSLVLRDPVFSFFLFPFPFLSSFFNIYFLFLRKLYCQHGAQTQDPDIKSWHALLTEPIGRPSFLLFKSFIEM